MCRFVKIRFMHPDVAVSLADPSCYLFSAVLTLNPLHHWPYMLYFATEASHVDYKDVFHSRWSLVLKTCKRFIVLYNSLFGGVAMLQCSLRTALLKIISDQSD